MRGFYVALSRDNDLQILITNVEAFRMILISLSFYHLKHGLATLNR